MRALTTKLFVAIALYGAVTAFATDEPERTVVIENGHFSPEVVEVPTAVRVKFVIDNRDPTPEEFESKELRREKVVP